MQLQLKVVANKLNKRKIIPANLPDANGIAGTVNKDFSFTGREVTTALPNPSLGKWYVDGDGYYYWGGGLIVTGTIADPAPSGPAVKLDGLPANLPEGFRLGVDLSHHNANPDWDGFKDAGVDFVYIKISEGVGTPDLKAKAHAENAKAKGIRIGYYHFCRPDSRNGGTVISDAMREAEEAVNLMQTLVKPDLPLVLDLEDQLRWDTPLGKKDYLAWINTFLAQLKAKTGQDGVLYSRKEYLDRKLPPNHGLGAHALWLSAYPSHPDCNTTKCPNGWPDWWIWQYTEKGSIGKNPVLDINIMKMP